MIRRGTLLVLMTLVWGAAAGALESHDPALLASVPHLGPIPLVFNLPAFGIVAIITWLLVIGTKETAWVNTLMVVIKVAIIGLFLVVGVAYVKPQQWSTPAFAPNGLAGISVGAAIIFFSYSFGPALIKRVYCPDKKSARSFCFCAKSSPLAASVTRNI